jgi:8-oxo-dGTP diphosphatase
MAERTLNGEPGLFRFCPHCGQALTTFHDGERLRRRCERCGWIHYRNPTVGVAVIIISDEGLWLGQRRSGGWCIPCGHVEWDESIEDAAKREALEETGLEVTLNTIFTAHSNFHNPEQHTVGIWFLAEAEDFSKASPGGDLIDLKPFPINKIPELVFLTDREVVKEIRQRFYGS